jgi:hypothetical protein
MSYKSRKSCRDPIGRPKPNWDVRPRTCLSCGDVFESKWIGNRVCKKCREREEWRFPDEEAVFERKI